MAKQIIKLTEGDLHRMIEASVKKIMEAEDWQKSYDEWAKYRDHCVDKDKDKGEKLNKKWTDEVKKAYPDKDKRRSEISKHMKRHDIANGKTSDKPYWKNYDKDMDESIERAIGNSINKLMSE